MEFYSKMNFEETKGKGKNRKTRHLQNEKKEETYLSNNRVKG